MSKKPETTSSMDPHLRAVLGAMQKQSEKYETALSDMHKLIRDENTQRVKEIEMIGKTIAELKLGISSSLAYPDINSIMTEDGASVSTVQKKKKTTSVYKQAMDRPLERSPIVEASDSEEEPNYDQPQFRAKTCLDFIPVING